MSTIQQTAKWRLRPSTDDVVGTDYGPGKQVTLHRRGCSHIRHYADDLPTAIHPPYADRLLQSFLVDFRRGPLCQRCLVEENR